jgi:hypothetical protein
MLNIGLLCSRYYHEENKTVKESKTKEEIFKDNYEYSQPGRYGISPHYGRQINVE